MRSSDDGEITLKDLRLVNKEKFIKKIIKNIKKLNIKDFQNSEFDLFIKDNISLKFIQFFKKINIKNINNINSLIDNFFFELSSDIVLFQKKIKLTQVVVIFILKI